MTLSPLFHRAAAIAACTGLSLSAGAAPQGGIDFDLTGLQVSQAIQTGSTPLVAGRSTMIRAAVNTNGTIPPGTEFDGVARVFIGGVEASFSPLYSSNGPLPALPMSSPGSIDGTLNFVFVAPDSDNVTIRVEINPPGPNQVIESDFSNNTSQTAAIDFGCTKVGEVMYVPIDYRPGGGGPANLPDFDLIKPGAGDNFIQAIFPVSDWEYRRSDVPSKLWTQSLSSGGSQLLGSLLTDLQMTTPQPDLIYGWVEGGLPYNGQAIGIPGQAGMGNTQPQRHQRTFAHELGHLFGLQHNNSDADPGGVDVEHHLAITQALPQIQNFKKDIMAAGLLTPQAWVWPASYSTFLNSAILSCAGFAQADTGPGNRLLVAGIWNPETAQLELGPAVRFEGGRASRTVPAAEADLLIRAWRGDTLVSESGIEARNSADHCQACRAAADSEDDVSPESGFVYVFPATFAGAEVERLEIIDRRTGATVGALERSSHAPVVEFVSPTADTPLIDALDVRWTASDADGDALTYYLRYSPDGTRFVPLATAITETGVIVPFGALPDLRPGAGFLELLATDGLNTTVVRTAGLGGDRGETAFAGANPPMVQMLTPDAGKSFPRAATVLLHSSGWDLEDRSINGAAIQWTSDLDGPIASGRVTSVTDLSIGVHVLTVTGTDSSGLQTSDTTTITITDRVLPGDPGEICQTDLGFMGPGTASLELCGGDLSSGTVGELRLSGAAPNAMTLLGVGSASSPTPFLGGTIVPLPLNNLYLLVTDGTGSLVFGTVQGGGGPFSLFAQALYADAGLLGGVGITNAVRADFLP